MGGTTRKQEYPYQFKTISVQNGKTCGYGASINFNLPADFIEAKNLWAHVRVKFDVSEPVLNRKITGIGPKTWPVDAAQPLMKPLNLTADANRVIDAKVDLTDLIPNLVLADPSYAYQGNFVLGIQHPTTLSYIATMELWKIDLVYTTQGIR